MKKDVDLPIAAKQSVVLIRLFIFTLREPLPFKITKCSGIFLRSVLLDKIILKNLS